MRIIEDVYYDLTQGETFSCRGGLSWEWTGLPLNFFNADIHCASKVDSVRMKEVWTPSQLLLIKIKAKFLAGNDINVPREIVIELPRVVAEVVRWSKTICAFLIIDEDEEALCIRGFCKTRKIKTLSEIVRLWPLFMAANNRETHFTSNLRLKVPFDAFKLFKKNNKKAWYDDLSQDEAVYRA